jgi:molecular chaperone HscB
VQLSLSGIEVQESDSLMDQSLLMEILEAREALEDAESEEEVESIRAENKGSSQVNASGLGVSEKLADLVHLTILIGPV